MEENIAKPCRNHKLHNAMHTGNMYSRKCRIRSTEKFAEKYLKKRTVVPPWAAEVMRKVLQKGWFDQERA